jgi:hypothetical protein
MFQRFMVFAVVVMAAGCSGSDELSLMPTPEVQGRLDAHVAMIFDGVSEESATQYEADRERVRRVHQIAWLVEQYHKETDAYPLVDPEGGVRNVMIGNPNTKVPKDDEHYVHEDTLLAALQDVLGYDFELPGEPLPDSKGFYCLMYGVYGRGYTVATMCYHPVGWSEGIMPGQWQYRVGSYESLDLPVMQASKLFAGEYASNHKARPRDPSMVNQ